MRILKEEAEAKESIPVSFLTDLMSKSWDEVGYLKDSSAAIKETYKDTDKIEEIMQDLMDAYLVFIGQLEAYLDRENDISPDVDEVEDSDDRDEDIEDDEMIDTDEEEEDDAEEEPRAFPAAKVKIDPVIAEDDYDEDDIRTERDIDADFDFYVDFDEPDMSKPGVSEKDLYGEEDSDFEYNKLKAQLFD